MNCNTIVCFDLEMCCWLNQSPGEIIEIGVAEIDVINRIVTRRSQYYITNEHDEISPFCTQLTGITQQLINKQGRPLAVALQSMTDRYGGMGKIYAAWGRDDIVLKDQCIINGIKIPFIEFINFAILYKVSQRKNDKRSIGMRHAMEQQKLEFEGRQHSGYDDAYNLARLALTFI